MSHQTDAPWVDPEEGVIAARRPQQIVEQHVLASVTDLVTTLAEHDDDWARELLCGDPNNEEEDPAYEVWKVSEWLARQLTQRGHRVRELWMGNHYWARGATGQAIKLDDVIEEIAKCR